MPSNEAFLSLGVLTSHSVRLNSLSSANLTLSVLGALLTGCSMLGEVRCLQLDAVDYVVLSRVLFYTHRCMFTLEARRVGLTTTQSACSAFERTETCSHP